MMKLKIVLLLVGATLISGFPEPDPDTNIDFSVDSEGSKVNSYLDVAKDAAGTSIQIMSKFFGKAMGYDCCYVDGVKYDNGATDVPCGDGFPQPCSTGTCVDGNVQCVSKIEVTYSIMVYDNVIDTIVLCVETLLTFFDVMEIAANQDNDFRFNSTNYGGDLGEYITCIDGLCNTPSPDRPYGDYWMFYLCTNASVQGCVLSGKGVSNTFPKNDDFYLFRYKFVNKTTGH